MKKLFALLLCLLLTCIASTALADYYPGDTVTVYIGVSDTQAVSATIKVQADSSAFTFVSSSLTGASGVKPNKNGGSFSIYSPDLETPLSGTIGTVTFSIKDVTPGDYRISVSVTSAYDVNDNSTSMHASGSRTITVGSKSCASHAWDEGVGTDPTCTEDGVKVYTCTVCGETKTVTTGYLGHTSAGWSVKEPATCTQDGKEIETCGRCQATLDTRTVPATGHKHQAVVTPPTCTEKGYTTYTCSACGDTYKGDEVPAAGHKYGDGVITTQPSCTKDGVMTYTCSVCGDTKTEPITATGHKHEAVVTPPTCTEKGYTTYTCSACGDTYKGDEVPAAGHKYVSVVTPPTCTEGGYTTHTCSVCGDTYKSDEVPATGHKYQAVVTAPTCTKDGYTTYTCSVCQHSYTSDVVTAPGHKYESVVTQPTCTEGGYTTHTCSVCGDTYKDSETAAAGHKYQAVVTAPTCTKDGYTTYTCSVCQHSYTDDVVPAAGHKYQAVVTAPTCTKGGCTTHTCSVCGDTYKDSETAATGHSYQASTVPATCTADGLTTHTCAACGDVYTTVLPATGHSWDEGVILLDATCTQDGEKLLTCQNDASHTTTQVIPAKGHTPGEWIVTKPVTQDESGLKERYCTVCGTLLDTLEIPNAVWYHMTVSSMGLRFRDVSDVTDKWLMFTAVDLSQDGEQVFDLVAGNMHIIGAVKVTVAEGYVTITCELIDEDIRVKGEFLTIFGSLADVTTLEHEQLTALPFGEPISIADQLNGDTRVLLFIDNEYHYRDDIPGLKNFDAEGAAYLTLVETMKEIMD